ncbi:MAG TPA: glycosyltransferase family 4 protein [Actinomycetota bacterium]
MGNPVVGAIRRLYKWDHQMNPRIAWLSPMPPAPSGVATYSRAVLGGLERIGYTRSHPPIRPIWPIDTRTEGTIPFHAMGIYHLGNNLEFHRDIYRHAIQTPGLLVVHDLALDDFAQGLLASGDRLAHQTWREGLANARSVAALPEAVENEPLRVPFVAYPARRARGIVVHAPFVKRYLEAVGCRTPIFVVPHPVVEKEEDVRRAEARRAVRRGPLETMGMRTLVGVFGDMNAAKLIEVVLEAVAGLPDDVHVVLVGRRIPGYDIGAVARGAGLGARLSVHTDVTDEEFLGWMCAADVAVDLRFPHRGEVSGSLARAMQCGRPTIVSSTGTYLDIPQDHVVRVSSGRVDPAELAEAIGRLVADPNLRDRIGGAARGAVRELGRSEATAHGYAEAMDGTLALLQDPGRRALARWGGALVDLGVSADALAEGYGVSYARALDEFRPPRQHTEATEAP